MKPEQLGDKYAEYYYVAQQENQICKYRLPLS